MERLRQGPAVTVTAALHPQLFNDRVAMNIERAAPSVPQFNDLAFSLEDANRVFVE
jgi:hypothetical protein